MWKLHEFSLFNKKKHRPRRLAHIVLTLELLYLFINYNLSIHPCWKFTAIVLAHRNCFEHCCWQLTIIMIELLICIQKKNAEGIKTKKSKQLIKYMLMW